MVVEKIIADLSKKEIIDFDYILSKKATYREFASQSKIKDFDLNDEKLFIYYRALGNLSAEINYLSHVFYRDIAKKNNVEYPITSLMVKDNKLIACIKKGDK